MMDKLLEVQEALSQFVIDIAKQRMPGNAVQILPEVVKAFVELVKLNQQIAVLADHKEQFERQIINILDKTKKAVQMGIVNQPLNNSGFVYAVKIDSETYVVNIEKYIPANQLIEKNSSLLTKM